MATVWLTNALSDDEAAALGHTWRHIELLHIQRKCPDECVCSQSAVLTLLRLCPTLCKLKVCIECPSSRHWEKLYYHKCEVQVDKWDRPNPIPRKVYPENETRSRVTDLFIAECSENTLIDILALCPYLDTLAIRHRFHYSPHTDLNEYTVHNKPAEFALHHINNSTITKLHLANCVTLSSEHISALHSLVELTICENEGINSDGILTFVNNCPQLKALRINRCVRVHSYVVLKILCACPLLHTFYFLTLYKEQWPREDVYNVLYEVVRHAFPLVYDFKLT